MELSASKLSSGRRVVLVGAALMAGWSAPAAAQTIGDRAVGLGGAYTALASDLSSLWYNPAGLVRSARQALTASASAYQIRSERVVGAINFHHPNRVFTEDMSASSINVFPSTLLYGRRWGEEGTRHALAAGVLLPTSDRSLGAVQLANEESRFQRSYRSTTRVQEWYAGPAYAGGTRTLSVGASALVRLYDREYDYDLFQEVELPNGVHTVTARVFTETFRHVSLVPSLGVRWTPTTWLEVGALAVAPGLPLWGATNVKRVVTQAGPLTVDGEDIRLQRQDTARPDPRQPTPWRLETGVAITDPGVWSLALTAVMSGALPPQLDRDEMLPNSTELEHNMLQRQRGVDLRAGGEWTFAPGWSVRAGVYTVGHHRHEFPRRSNETTAGARYADTVGLNLALGVDGDDRSSSYGLNLARGKGQSLGFHASPPGGPGDPVRNGAPLHEKWSEPSEYAWWSATVMISGAVESD